jgi:REP element-mobilizing transposase RayT
MTGSAYAPRFPLVPRQARGVLPSFGVFHVTARGVDKCAIFRDEYDYALFENLLEIVHRREKLRIEAYCLMPNHFHAILEAGLDAVSRAMHRLNGVYAQGFNARYDRSGHLFQSRFDARLIVDDHYLANACAYVLDNPVRAGLCASPGDWRWSGRMT